MIVDLINDEFVVDCTNSTREQRQEVYKFLITNRGYSKDYLECGYNRYIVCNRSEGFSNFNEFDVVKERFPDYAVLTYAEFKERYLDVKPLGKLIGYRLIKKEYKMLIKVLK
jgi:hypothetical protein